ncbi:hypothetical protein [Dialister succinatiphilus]
MMNEQVKKILENNLWEAATVCSKGFPNVVLRFDGLSGRGWWWRLRHSFL